MAVQVVEEEAELTEQPVAMAVLEVLVEAAEAAEAAETQLLALVEAAAKDLSEFTHSGKQLL
jgi:hypothetical protein